MKAILAFAALGLAPAVFAASLQPADAAQHQQWEALRTIVRQHVDVNAPQPDGTTALGWAAHWNNLESVNLLLRAGADPKRTNRYGASALSEAAALGNAP